MKKISKRSRLFVLIGILICAAFIFLWMKWDTKRSQTDFSESSVVGQLLNRRIASVPTADSTFVMRNTTNKAQQSKSEMGSSKDVCDQLAEGRKTENDWKRFEADLQEKLDARLPDLEIALERATHAKDPIEKASALYMLAMLRVTVASSTFTQDKPQCGEDEKCSKQLRSLENVAQEAILNEIAKMAIYSPDPKLYMIAFNACIGSFEHGDSYCSQINARQWASRDPSNGMAWMYVLTQLPRVQNGKSSSAVDEALYRISQAKYFDGGYSISSNLKHSPYLHFDDQFMQVRMEELAVAIWVSTALPSYFQVENVCKGVFLNNPNRRQICDEIAKNWQRDDAQALEFRMASRLGENLGWEAKRIAKIKDELSAINGMLILENQELEALRLNSEAFARKNCKSLLQQLQDTLAMLSDGELKKYRKKLAQRNKTQS